MIRPLLNRAIWSLALLLAAAILNAHAADVIYGRRPGKASFAQQQVKTAADFYGLNEKVVVMGSTVDSATIAKAVRDPDTVGVVLSADVLSSLNKGQLLAALRRTNASSVSLLITEIDDKTDKQLLKNWSEGAITGCITLPVEEGTGSYKLATVKGVTYELGGNTLPMNGSNVHYLTLDGTSAARIMTADIGTRDLPVFVVVRSGPQGIFFATAHARDDTPIGPSPYREPGVFASLAPQMMFMRSAGGERGWHSPGSYANLTIDDAWLREPYGYVNYAGLLGEMKKYNFHTTIAFVPWNFDRSQPALVSVFRAHGDRYSICIHGNNHDHQEFGAYDSKPLSGQTNDIKQGLARMAKFGELTGLPYDPVMVFPHSISPELTLGLLKRYNFWGTANSLNVPMGSTTPSDAEFALRTATLAFSNFPSWRRYSAEAPGPDSQLVVDAFLGNPMLFYVHQAFFASGIDAFNKTADTVNRIQPRTQWRSLGDIAQHLYLERMRYDGNYDIRAYSGTIRLHNDRDRDITFFVEKEEDFQLPLTVLVDGHPHPYERAGTMLRVRLAVGKGQSREIAVKYTNDLNIAGIDISRSSWRIQAIRRLSDFRDNVVSKSELGRRFVRSYSENWVEWNRGAVAVMGLIAVLAACWYRRRGARRSLTSRRSSLHEMGGRV